MNITSFADILLMVSQDGAYQILCKSDKQPRTSLKKCKYSLEYRISVFSIQCETYCRSKAFLFNTGKTYYPFHSIINQCFKKEKQMLPFDVQMSCPQCSVSRASCKHTIWNGCHLLQAAFVLQQCFTVHFVCFYKCITSPT